MSTESAQSALLQELLPALRHNCLVSDATNWGYYTTCSLLLRLREQYRFEHDLGAGAGVLVRHSEVLDWIGQREAAWAEYEDRELMDIPINGRSYAPFDLQGINEALAPRGLLYGAGYGAFEKPVFFLAELASTSLMHGVRVFIAGREYARDLSMNPAMAQADAVVVRREVVRMLMAEKHAEMLSGKPPSATLLLAFGAYGAAEAGAELEGVVEGEVESLMHHEIGEVLEGRALGEGLWAEALAELGMDRSTLGLRGLKDVLADTGEYGMLRHIIAQGKAGSLGFYIHWLTGTRYHLSAPLRAAFLEFRKHREWEIIESARAEVYGRARALAKRVIEAHREGLGARRFRLRVAELLAEAGCGIKK